MPIAITSREALISNLRTYETRYQDEKEFIYRFLELLRHPDCYQRTHLPGHITGSSMITDESREYVLLVHHVKLGKWLQPGGHADGDENITRVAQREAEEETGLKSLMLLRPSVFDIDVHPIPARTDIPEHLHFDVRFLFQASSSEKIQVSHESHDVRWIHRTEVSRHTGGNASINRMLEKIVNVS